MLTSLPSKFVSAACLLLLIGGCGPSKQDVQVAASEKALKALHKLQAATQVGVTLPVFRQQLIEAQAEVNEAARLFPDDSFFAWRLRKTMDCYIDAAHFWELQTTGRHFYDDPGDADGHALTYGYAAVGDGLSPSGHLEGDPRKGVQIAWRNADMFLPSIEKELEARDFAARQTDAKLLRGNRCRVGN